MRLYTATIIKSGEDAIEIVKNKGGHIAWVSAHCFDKALKQGGSQIVIEENGKRYGFQREYVKNFLRENCIQCVDMISAQEKFNLLREVNI